MIASQISVAADGKMD